jgi:hypothetical protein
MGTVRLLPVLLLVLLLGGQLLHVSDLAYATCMCDQACPQPRGCGACDCNCFGTCAVDDYSQSYNAHSTNFQIRSVHSPLFTNDAAGNDLPRAVTILAMPQGFVKLQCQRLKEMLKRS